MDVLKKCSKCGESKPATAEFFHRHRNATDGLASCCKECRKRDDRVRFEDPIYKATVAARSIAWGHAHPAARATHRRKWLYGLGQEEYTQLLTEQRGVCAICERLENVRKSAGQEWRLSVDHDHATGAVRGLLSNGCNRGLGYFDDNPVLLVRAALYLARYKHPERDPFDVVQEILDQLRQN